MVVKIAILDLYDGTENEGMRCIRELLSSFSISQEYSLIWDEFNVRQLNQLPDISYDIFISSGGPGSPLLSDENKWEKRYLQLLDNIIDHNKNTTQHKKKHVFFICHSFQIACQYFKVAEVSKRKSMSFGVFPTHILTDVKEEPVFSGLDDPFFIVDSRHYQIIQPDNEQLEAMGGKVLSVEKDRPHIPLERAVMALRFNDYMIGTQFHPEVDADGMRLYLLKDEIKETVISNHGEEKWESMLTQLDDPEKIRKTHSTILPNFIRQSIRQLIEANTI